MKYVQSITVTVLLVMGLMACGSSASEVTGTIDGSVGDQSERWVTFRQETPAGWHSTSTFGSPIGLMTSITLQGHLEKHFQIQGMVSIEITLMNDRVVEAGVSYFPEDSTFPFYGDHEGSVKLDMETLDIDGEQAKVAGVISGRIFKTTDFTSPPDTSDALDVSLEFEAMAYKEE